MGYKPTLQEFLLNRNLVAVRLGPDDMPGMFQRRLTIPANTAAIAAYEDGSTVYLAEGHEVSGRCDLVIAKDGLLELKMIFPDLKTSDGYSINATCGAAVRVLADRPDLFKDFVRGPMQGQSSYSTSDLKAMMGRELKRILTDFVTRFSADELNRKGAVGDFEERFSVAVERFLFGTGVKYERFLDVSFASHEFEQAQEERRQRDAEDKASQARLRKKEDRIQRIAGVIQDESLQGILAKVDDEKVRAIIYAKMMEDDAVDLDAEDLVARLGSGGEEVIELLHRTLVNLTGRGAEMPVEPVPVERAERFYLATGSKVIEVDPQRPSDTPREYEFPSPLRSVRPAKTMYGDSILGGGKTSVMLLTPSPDGDGSEPAFLDFPLPRGGRPRGGFNAIAAYQRWIFATHSEYGLSAWDANQPGDPATILMRDVTAKSKTTRAVAQVTGGVVFASGPDVYRVTVPEPAESLEEIEIVRYPSNMDSPITTVTASKHFIFAGTAAGAILCWRKDEPEDLQVVVRRKDPIASVHIASINGIPHLLYSSHDLSVHARVIGQNLETSYDAGGSSVAFMVGAADRICALDSSGMHLMVWKTGQPARPSDTVDCWRFAQKPALDLWIKKTSEPQQPGQDDETKSLPPHMQILD